MISPAVNSAAMENVQAQFEALLWEPVLEPLERVFGPYGSIALQGFTDALAQAMEQRHE